MRKFLLVLFALFFTLQSVKSQDSLIIKNSVKERKNYIYTNPAFLLFNSEINLGYERKLFKLLSLNLYTGYKFSNFLRSNSGPVRALYEGSRGNIAIRYNDSSGFFIGFMAGGSLLSINGKTAYSSASSYAEYYDDLYSTRKDLDIGITLGGHFNVSKVSRIDIVINYGLRNVWANTTYGYHHPGSYPVGGAVLFSDIAILNGNINVQFLQIGITYGIKF